ncbi:MAG: galactose-1-phosphate uridylyltransferase [Candidatus Eisenbacteria bacterium]
MPELRKDPVVGRWVIIATERGKRPSDFGRIESARKGGFCPFCPGNESKTPPEVFAFRSPDSRPNEPGWTVRVVSNKFPALQIEGGLNRRAEGIYDKMNGVGAHEVIIETTDHNLEMSQLPVEQIERVLFAYRERMLDLAKDKRFRYLQVFKNHGEAAGASLEHSHSQLIATPIIPRRVHEELNGCSQHFQIKERCIYCDIVDQEIAFGKRLVCENEKFVVLEPFAPRFPFETWLIPKEHEHFFEEDYSEEEGFLPLARIFKEMLTRMNVALNNPPYNFVLHTSPSHDWENPLHYHWHLELMPKLTKVAGFEWGTGFYINPTPPEEAAEYLREAMISADAVASGTGGAMPGNPGGPPGEAGEAGSEAGGTGESSDGHPGDEVAASSGPESEPGAGGGPSGPEKDAGAPAGGVGA